MSRIDEDMDIIDLDNEDIPEEAAEAEASHDPDEEIIDLGDTESVEYFDEDTDEAATPADSGKPVTEPSDDDVNDFLTRNEHKKKHKHKKHGKHGKAKKRGHGILVAVLLITLLAGLGVGGYFVYTDYTGRVYSHAIIEAGDVTVTPEDFAKDPLKEVFFADGFDISSIDPKVPGDYKVALTSGFYTYESTLTVEDTTAPTADPIPVTLEFGGSASPEDFLENIFDVTEVTASFEKEPDYTKGGESKVSLLLSDTSGNQTTYESTLTIIPVHSSVTIEAGSEFPSVEAYLLKEMGSENNGAVLLTSADSIDTLIPGEYPVNIKLAGGTYESKLIIEDTVAPVITVRDFEGYTTSNITPESLIETADDLTELTYSFKEEPSFDNEGTYEVTVVATDMGGNTAEAVSVLTLAKDTEAPVITGAKDITVMQNYPISYRDGITVTDNCDEDIVLKIEADSVNPKELGTYPIVYSATDRAGNTTEIPVSLTIIEEHYDEATIYALASQTLARITNPTMTDYEKISAIYWYVKRNMAYTESDNKDDWLKAAYYGLALHKGDCYSYCCSCKAMFDVLGIKNMIIDTYPLRIIHFWNLVDLGEGWRHFDTTPRIGGGDFLYMDDATITAYSVTHGNSHIYDHSRFPGIQ